jgi:hypothetical protein
VTLAADWVTISALATAAGTLVLALATFASVRQPRRARGRAVAAGRSCCPRDGEAWTATAARHWNIDRDEPR